MVRGFGRRAALRAVGSHRRSPLVAGAFREQRISGGSPDGWAAQGTLQVRPCKLDRRIHAAHAPAQPTHPAPDRFLRGQPRKSNKKSRSNADRFALRRLIAGISLVAGQRPALPGSIHAWRGSTAVRGKLLKAGWVRLRGCERHGCRDQAPMDGFTASPATGPTPPSHTKPAIAVAFALALAVALAWAPLRVPGAARPEPIRRFRYNVGPVSQLRFPGHDGPRGRARPVAVPPRTS